jgi:glycosyltransferase involved in cell wall biosynthesis
MITAVIPAFNEEKTVSQVVEGARRHVAEVIVVDDGSEDATSGKAMSAGARIVRIPRNSGKANALAIGLTTAALNGSNIVVCLDADGQHDPNDIPRIVQPILDGRADVVIGSRFLDAQSKEMIPGYRRLGQGVLTLATNIGSTVKVTDSQSGFRAFRREVVEGFDYSSAQGMEIESSMVRNAVKRGLRIEEVSIVAKYEGLDTSTLKPGSHGFNVLGSVLKSIRSEHPLMYFGASGFVMTIVGVFFGLYSIQGYIETRALPFGPSLIAVMLTALGVLFVLVGLILNAISEMVNTTKSRRNNGR